MESSVRTTKWKKRPTNQQNYRTQLFLAFFLILFCFGFFVYSKALISHSIFPPSKNSRPVLSPECSSTSGGEKFLWYAPHSGFSNQLSEFKNAVLMAAILNRTLVVPPVLDHHAVALGSCPKFRVLDPNELRFRVWNHSVSLVRERRYISLADVIDLSSLTSISSLKFLDFRDFVSMWCGVSFNIACSESNSQSSMHEKLKHCGSFLSGYTIDTNNCIYPLQEDCRTTVWTYQTDDDGKFDSFQADDELKKKKKISYSRKRRDVYKALGSNPATVLAFGSLFSSPYKGSESHIDFHKARKIQFLNNKIEFLPFVPEILNAGKKFALETIKAPFVCAQLRLLDGQFKNHWKTTFQELEKKLDSLRKMGRLPVHIFVMTDLPLGNWSGTNLGDLAKDSDNFKVFVLREEDELVTQTAKKLLSSENSMKFQHCNALNALSLPDVLLYIEESICSCGSLGFIGTAGSTIAESIELMRRNNACLG